MRRLFTGFALLCVAACGKTRAVDPPGSSWEDPSAENGFYESDRACSQACVVPAPRTKHAVRATPEARVLTTIDTAMPGLVFIEPDCLALAARGPMNDGAVLCVNVDDGQVTPKTRIGFPSALVWTDRLYAADRDPNGASRVLFGEAVIAGKEHDIRTLVGHRGEAFWIDGGSRVRRLRHDQEYEVDIVARVNQLDARFLAVDDGGFYVVRGGALVRIPRVGESPEVLATAASPIRDVVLSGEWLYWTEQGEAHLVCQPDGTSPSCHARGSTVIHPTGLLRRVRVTAPFQEQLLASDLEDVSGVLIVRSFAYASTRRGLLRVPLVAGGSPTLLPTATPAFGRPVLDTVGWTVIAETRPPGLGASGTRLVALVP